MALFRPCKHENLSSIPRHHNKVECGNAHPQIQGWKDGDERVPGPCRATSLVNTVSSRLAWDTVSKMKVKSD